MLNNRSVAGTGDPSLEAAKQVYASPAPKKRAQSATRRPRTSTKARANQQIAANQLY
jgi:hypothetical protein